MLLRTTLISTICHLAKLKRLLSLLFIGCSFITLSACSSWLPDAHTLDLQQGNTVKIEQIEAIKLGMTKTEVRDVMGLPMLSDPFHNQRWDYIYRFIPNMGVKRESLLTLYFNNDILTKIDDSKYVAPE